MTELHITASRDKIENGELVFEMSLYYDTFNKKEALKRLGYKYDKSAWEKTVTLSELDQAIAETKAVDSIKICHCMIDVNEIELAKRMYCEEEIKSFPIPSKPEILRGKFFNKKIYGAQGTYCIYLDNVETKISDETAETIRKWLSGEDIEEYNTSLKRLIRKSCRNDEWEDLIGVVEEQQSKAIDICKKYLKKVVNV